MKKSFQFQIIIDDLGELSSDAVMNRVWHLIRVEFKNDGLIKSIQSEVVNLKENQVFMLNEEIRNPKIASKQLTQ
jgi:hypothetical protein